MRINALTRSYEQEFTKYGIPYKVFGGFRFFERREIKDVLAYLRIIANPYDNEALERIINVPKRGIGSKTIDVMNEYARDNGYSLYDAAVDSDELPVPQATRRKIKEFADLLKKLVLSSVDMPVAQLVREVIIDADLRSAYDDGTDEGDGKLANLDEFIASVDDYSRLNPRATLDEYLNQVTLSSDLDDMDDGNYVTLATIHAVKGLEFPVVFICGLEDGIMPSSRADSDGKSEEEERRLMYVAITRAREKLYLTRSRSRYLYGHRDLTKPSRFLVELTPVLGNVVADRTPYYYAGNGKKYVSSYKSDRFINEEKSSGRALYSSSDGVESDLPKSSGNFKAFWGGQKKTEPVKSSQTAGKYTVGMRVRHPKFGVGMIVAVKNGGQIVNVAFDGQGVKELAAAFAPLTVL